MDIGTTNLRILNYMKANKTDLATAKTAIEKEDKQAEEQAKKGQTSQKDMSEDLLNYTELLASYNQMSTATEKNTLYTFNGTSGTQTLKVNGKNITVKVTGGKKDTKVTMKVDANGVINVVCEGSAATIQFDSKVGQNLNIQVQKTDNEMTIKTGAGNDTITLLDGAKVKDLTTGKGNDTVYNSGTISGTVSTEDGADAVINNGTIGNITTALGDDLVVNNGQVTGNINTSGKDNSTDADEVVNTGTVGGVIGSNIKKQSNVNRPTGFLTLNGQLTKNGNVVDRQLVNGVYYVNGKVEENAYIDDDELVNEYRTPSTATLIEEHTFNVDGNKNNVQTIKVNGEDVKVQVTGGGKSTEVHVAVDENGLICVRNTGDAATITFTSSTNPKQNLKIQVQESVGTLNITAKAGDTRIYVLENANVGNITTDSGDDIIYNFGNISGKVLVGAGNDTLVNLGTIVADTDGQKGDDYIVNKGTIKGIINGNTNDDQIINDGYLDGSIFGAAGNDKVVETDRSSKTGVISDGTNATKKSGNIFINGVYYTLDSKNGDKLFDGYDKATNTYYQNGLPSKGYDDKTKIYYNDDGKPCTGYYQAEDGTIIYTKDGKGVTDVVSFTEKDENGKEITYLRLFKNGLPDSGVKTLKNYPEDGVTTTINFVNGAPGKGIVKETYYGDDGKVVTGFYEVNGTTVYVLNGKAANKEQLVTIQDENGNDKTIQMYFEKGIGVTGERTVKNQKTGKNEVINYINGVPTSGYNTNTQKYYDENGVEYTGNDKFQDENGNNLYIVKGKLYNGVDKTTGINYVDGVPSKGYVGKKYYGDDGKLLTGYYKCEDGTSLYVVSGTPAKGPQNIIEKDDDGNEKNVIRYFENGLPKTKTVKVDNYPVAGVTSSVNFVNGVPSASTLGKYPYYGDDGLLYTGEITVKNAKTGKDETLYLSNGKPATGPLYVKETDENGNEKTVLKAFKNGLLDTAVLTVKNNITGKDEKINFVDGVPSKGTDKNKTTFYGDDGKLFTGYYEFEDGTKVYTVNGKPWTGERYINELDENGNEITVLRYFDKGYGATVAKSITNPLTGIKEEINFVDGKPAGGYNTKTKKYYDENGKLFNGTDPTTGKTYKKGVLV